MKPKNFYKSLILKSLIFIFLLLTQSVIGQDIEINPGFGTINEKSVKGFVVCLELDVKSVEVRWQSYLKSLGKFESPEKMAMYGQAIMISAISSDAIDFYSKITVSPRCLQVFMGATRAGTMAELDENQQEHVKRLLREFAIEQYRQDLIAQITEAERVVNLAVKAHDKRSNESQTLKNRLAKNRKEKANLYKSLEDNAHQQKKLQADSVQNALDLEAAMEEIKKVRAIAEEKKTRLGQLK